MRRVFWVLGVAYLTVQDTPSWWPTGWSGFSWVFLYHLSKYRSVCYQTHIHHTYTGIWMDISLLYLAIESPIIGLPRKRTKHSHLAAVRTCNCLLWCLLHFLTFLHDDLQAEFHTPLNPWNQFKTHCTCSVIHGYQPLSQHLWKVAFTEVQGFNLTVCSRVSHCDKQVWRTNLTGNRTEIRHSPLEEGVCVDVCVWMPTRVCVWACTNVFVE